MQKTHKRNGVLFNQQSDAIISHSYSEVRVSAFQFLQRPDVADKANLFNVLNAICDLIQKGFIVYFAHIFFKRFIDQYLHSCRNFLMNLAVSIWRPVFPFPMAFANPKSSVSETESFRAVTPIFLAIFKRSFRSFIDLDFNNAVSIQNEFIKYNH
jgi:hypothetical protein